MSRTQVQQAAKRAWDALCEAELRALELRRIPGGEEFAYRAIVDIESAFVEIEKLMHEDDWDE